jgi:exonuclease III
MKYQGNEYKEFIPNTKRWNQHKLNKKINNIIDVLKTKDFDIICLQEIESKDALQLLINKLAKYKYSYFYKKPKSAIGLSIISKYPIISNQIIKVQKYNPRSRDILKSTIKIDNKEFVIFINHWRSKRAAENTRIPYAISLMKHLKKIDTATDYIILGDLNSNYNEDHTFKYNKRLNNTDGITAINQILNTSINNILISKNNILNQDQIVHYNLWLDKKRYNRYSYKYKGNKETPDNIILSSALFDNKNISYIDSSFDILYSKKQSDHLLIFASFSTNNNFEIKQNKLNTKHAILSTNQLYNIDNLQDSIRLNTLRVIYKIDSRSAILKSKMTQAIYLYKCANPLKRNHSYDLNINKINRFNGLLEIVNISHIKEVKNTNDNISSYYLDAKEINIFKPEYQNEIIKNLKGIYKKRYLYFTYNGENKKIRIYAKNKDILPLNNNIIIINSGHISTYKSQIQITLHKRSDYKQL